MNKNEHLKRKKSIVLKTQHDLAIDLRLRGLTYREISKNEGITATEHTVRTWFMDGGICAKEFHDRKTLRKLEVDELFKDIDQQIKEGAVEAIFYLKKAMRNGSVAAAIKILELAGFDGKQAELPFEYPSKVEVTVIKNYAQ